VKQHKWFSKINWGLLRNTEPPVSRTIWVTRLWTVVYRFVYYVSLELWPWSQHMVLFPNFYQSLVNHRSGADIPVFGRQIIPASSNGADTVNFRRMEESTSLHLEKQQHAVMQTPGTPDGLEPASGGDLFGAFSSITLHHDGDN
jgi:hypothetical protein